jgi:Cu+-exporting ATPase
VTLLGLEQHVYFEASAAVITLVLLGKLLEARAKAGTSEAIEALIRLQPKTAASSAMASAGRSAADSLMPGDIFMVRPGESVPVDGVVVDGASSINEAMLTGESMPVGKAAGERVLRRPRIGSGSCAAGPLASASIRCWPASSVWSAEAQGSKAPVQRLADRYRRSSCRWSASSRCSPSPAGGFMRAIWPRRWSMPSPCW